MDNSKRTGVYVGLDYSQDAVQVCVMDGQGQMLCNCGCENDWQAIERQASAHGRVLGAAIEACTGAASLTQELVDRAGWPVSMAHPGYVARLKGSPDKSDYSDGRLLADLCRVGYVPKVWLAPPALRHLRDLVRYRQQLVDERRRGKQRVRALLQNHRLSPPAGCAPWTRAWLGWLTMGAVLAEPSQWVLQRHLELIEDCTKRIKQADAHLRKTMKDDAMVNKLMEQPGIGEVTAWVIRAEIGYFGRFQTGKQVSRFCGVSPRNASSGQRTADAGLIKAGSNLLRATLIEAAHRLRRRDPRWMAFSAKLKNNGKPGSVIAAAVANRFMRKLFWDMRQVPMN